MNKAANIHFSTKGGDRSHFFTMVCILAIVAILKAWILLVIIKILHKKNTRVTQPFTGQLRRFILYLAALSVMVGIFSGYGARHSSWLQQQGLKMPDTQWLHLGGADVWLFMAIILVVIAQIVKRGIEIQAENELTV